MVVGSEWMLFLHSVVFKCPFDKCFKLVLVFNGSFSKLSFNLFLCIYRTFGVLCFFFCTFF